MTAARGPAVGAPGGHCGMMRRSMTSPRASGILLHPTSLPGRFGIGDLGPEACRWLDFLAAAGSG